MTMHFPSQRKMLPAATAVDNESCLIHNNVDMNETISVWI